MKILCLAGVMYCHCGVNLFFFFFFFFDVLLCHEADTVCGCRAAENSVSGKGRRA